MDCEAIVADDPRRYGLADRLYRLFYARCPHANNKIVRLGWCKDPKPGCPAYGKRISPQGRLMDDEEETTEE